MSAAEDELVRLASGVNWRIDKLAQMQSSLDALKRRVERVRDAIQSGHWEGGAADAAETQLTAIVETFTKASEWVQKVHTLIDQHSEDVRSEAQAKLNSLPTGDLPSAVRDAIDRGKPEPMAQYGIIGALTGPAGMLTAGLFFANQREDRAKEAIIELRESIGKKKESLDELIARGFDPIGGKRVGPEMPKQGSSDPRDWQLVPGGPGTGGPGGGVGGGPGVGSGPHLPGPGGYPGGPGYEPPGSGPDPDGPPHPERPLFPDEPPVRPEPTNPGGGPGEGPGDGNGGPRNPGDGPSVDSGLDGTIGRTGLGAAGLGAVGLAAGAKIASSGSGLGGVLGGASGLGQGIAGLGAGGGLRGAATAAGAGGAGAGGSGASGSRAGRPGMMMGGGGGAAGSDKKGSKRGLGGYLAPKLEDEGDGGPAARASRAGGRGDDFSDD